MLHKQKTFHHTVTFSGVKVKELFDTYLDSVAHAKALAAPVTIGNKENGSFQIFGADGIKGRNLVIIPNQLIVQTWRGQIWKPDDLDSILILKFEAIPTGATILLTHANVPEHAEAMVNANAWNEKYWEPWKQYFLNKNHSRTTAKLKG